MDNLTVVGSAVSDEAPIVIAVCLIVPVIVAMIVKYRHQCRRCLTRHEGRSHPFAVNVEKTLLQKK